MPVRCDRGQRERGSVEQVGVGRRNLERSHRMPLLSLRCGIPTPHRGSVEDRTVPNPLSRVCRIVSLPQTVSFAGAFTGGQDGRPDALVVHGGHDTKGHVMRRSTDRILTTHVGALPAPLDVWAHPEVADDRLREAVAEVVAAQRDAGVDFINEGELTKGGHWVEYLPTRLGGYEPSPEGGAYGELLMSSKDWVDFLDFYLAVLKNGTLFEQSGGTQHVPEGADTTAKMVDDWVAAEPIHFKGQALLDREIAVMKEALGDTPVSDAFLTSTAPLSVEPGRVKGIYGSDEEHIYAIADAMRVE